MTGFPRAYEGSSGVAQYPFLANMARAYAALGTDGVEESTALVRPVATALGGAERGILSSETTAQEWPIGSPNAPGLWRGVAPRGGRALAQRTRRGGPGVANALAHVETSRRSVKAPQLCATGKDAKHQGFPRRLPAGGQVVGQPRPLEARLSQSRARMPHGAMATLGARHEVVRRLVPQRVPWRPPGVVTKGQRWHAGLPQARVMVRNQAGKQGEGGLPYLRRRLGGGEVCGTLRHGGGDASNMPGHALASSRTRCGPPAPPEVVSSERGKTAGSIGTLNSPPGHCNKPEDRLWQTLEMAGPRSLWSCNLHPWMRDVVRAGKAGKNAWGQTGADQWE